MENKKSTNQETTNNFVQLQGQVQVFLSNDEESVIHLLPGDGKIQLPVNFYKAIFGIAYTPKPKMKNTERPNVYGFIARPNVYLSRDCEYLIHRVPGFKVSRHVNYYKKILGLEFSPKSQLQESKKVRA
jgi:hypothetical protein